MTLLRIRLRDFPSGGTYSSVYKKWTGILKEIAEAEEVIVEGPPRCWVPLILYLGGQVQNPLEHFDVDHLVPNPEHQFETWEGLGQVRRFVEWVCVLRPELVDALWKSDAEWNTVGRRHQWESSFYVTTYNSWWRPEIRVHMEELKRYTKPQGVCNVVITNCSADKPYPDSIHKEIIKRLPDKSWHLVIASGPLGVVPEEMWGEMPLYDAGIPNFWRCQQVMREYFARHKYKRIVVYTEFYTRSIVAALTDVLSETYVQFAIPVGPYCDYLDLTDSENLGRLEQCLRSHAELSGTWPAGLD